MTAYIRFLQNGIPVRGGVPTGAHAGWSELLGFSMGGGTSVSGLGRVKIKTYACPSHQASMLMQWSVGGFRAQAQPPRAAAGAANTYRGVTTIDQGIVAFNAAGAGRQPARSTAAPVGKGTDVKIYFCASDSAANQPDNVVAEVDFAAQGGSAAGFRVLIHGIRIVRYQRTANGPVFRTTNFVTGDPRTSRAGDDRPTEQISMNFTRITHAGAPASAPDISHHVRGRLLLGPDQGVWARRGPGAALQVHGGLSLGSEAL